MSRPNTTQRSWDNYEGDNPIKNWVGKSPVDEARYYSDSSKYGPGSSWKKSEKNKKIPEGYEIDPETGEIRKKSLKTRFEEKSKQDSQWKKLQRDSALRRSMEAARKGKLLEQEYDEDSYVS